MLAVVGIVGVEFPPSIIILHQIESSKNILLLH